MKRSSNLLTLTTAGAFILFATAASAQSYDNKDRRVVIINDTSEYMVGLYASNVGTDSWEENMVRGRPVAPGASLTANIDDGTGFCHYDLRAVFESGAHVERHRVNVCNIETWRLED